MRDTDADNIGPTSGDRVVANTSIDYINNLVLKGDEGTVQGYTGRDGDDILVEWDAGYLGSAHFGDLTVIEEKESL